MRTYCVYPGHLYCDDKEAEEFIRQSLVSSTSIWNTLRDHRYELDTFMKGRTKACSRGFLSCCGACTFVCRTRCATDIASRLQLYVLEDPTRLKALMDPAVTYEQYCGMVNSIISGYFNADRRRSLRSRGIIENPNKFAYYSHIAMEPHPRTGKPRPQVDTRTGRVILLQWPESGMCPHCLPVNSGRNRVCTK